VLNVIDRRYTGGINSLSEFALSYLEKVRSHSISSICDTT